MYTLSKGPNKIIANTRRGPPKQLEILDNWDTGKRPSDGPNMNMSAPKPVFNGKKSSPNRPNNNFQNESLSPQHEEMVRLLTDSWNKVHHEYETFQKQERDGGPVYYKERKPNPQLQNFKAIDLEDFLGTRSFKKITGSS